MSGTVSLSIEAGIADVRLSRPDKLNALNAEMFTALNEVIGELAAATGVRVVILSGSGRAFCAGLDMAAMAAGGTGIPLERRDFGAANAVQQAAWGWRCLPMPVIAAVHGVAFGAGLQIMSGADIRIGRRDARFSIRETYWGLVPDMAGFALWRSLIREDVIRELTYTAREFDGSEAERLGFVTMTSADPLAKARELAETIISRSPDAIAAAKRLINLSADEDAAALLRAETHEQMRLKGTANQAEAVAAHQSRRNAIFEN